MENETEKNKKTIQNLEFFKPLIAPFKWHIITLITTGVGWSMLLVIKAYALKLIIDSLTTFGTVALFWPITIYLSAWILSETLNRLRDFAIMYFKPYLKQHVVTSVTKMMLQYNEAYFQQKQTATLNYGLRNLHDSMEDGIYIVEELFCHGILIVSSLISMYILNKYLSYIAISWFLLWSILAFFWTRNGYKLSYKISTARTKLTFHLGDLFSNTSTIKTFNAIDSENRITNNLSKDVAEIEFKREKMFFSIWIMQGILFFIIFALIFLVLIKGYENKLVTIGDFAMLIEILQALYLYLFDFAKDISEFADVIGKIQQGTSIIYQPQAIEKTTNIFAKELSASKGEIILDKIAYKYPNSDKETDFAMQGQIKIPAGSTIALIGPSGSGKSTLIKLLLRLIEPNAGKILIDGQNIAECEINSVRSIFAFVPQELGLLHRSIGDNIKYGKQNATMEEVIQAAKKAKIHDLITQMPKGYDTIYGQETGLSGGQKQRIMIARGLLRNAKIFIFDESTSALDIKTEKEVMENIKQTTDGMTKIVIAHRLNSVKHMDMIIVCDEGEIIETGTHNQLMEQKGYYHSIMQLI